MGVKYRLEAYDPELHRRVHVCSEQRLWYAIKYGLAAKRRGLKYFILIIWLGR
jgi:hypothetical protein